jgi:hypothetical protein
MVATHRTRSTLSGHKQTLRGDHSRFNNVMAKMPSDKLRLSARPEVAIKLDQLAGGEDVDPDVAVAAFYEYAAQRFRRLDPGVAASRRLGDLLEEAHGVASVTPGSVVPGEVTPVDVTPVSVGADSAGSVATRDEAGRGLAVGGAVRTAGDGLCPPPGLDELLAAIAACVAGLGTASPRAAFLDLGALAARAAEAADEAEANDAGATAAGPDTGVGRGADPTLELGVALGRLADLGIAPEEALLRPPPPGWSPTQGRRRSTPARRRSSGSRPPPRRRPSPRPRGGDCRRRRPFRGGEGACPRAPGDRRGARADRVGGGRA